MINLEAAKLFVQTKPFGSHHSPMFAHSLDSAMTHLTATTQMGFAVDPPLQATTDRLVAGVGASPLLDRNPR